MGVAPTGPVSSVLPAVLPVTSAVPAGANTFAVAPASGPLAFSPAVERNIKHYLNVNFGSAKFAELWHQIHIGASNNEFLRRTKDALDPDSPKVLDLGTGTGKALLPLAKAMKRGTLVGLDRSDPMLGVARREMARQFPHLDSTFINGNVDALDTELPPRFQDFDAVTARFLFNFVDLDVVLPQVRSRLKEGGKVVFNIFSAFYHGYNEAFRAQNSFEVARIKAAKEVLEELVIPSLTEAQREKLINEGHIRLLPSGKWEILAEPVTQKKGFDRISLERALKKAGFEDVVIDEVEEMYPAEEKQKSFLLTASIPYFMPIMNCITNNRELCLRLVQEIWQRMPDVFKKGEHKFTDIFVSARKPRTSGADAQFIAETAAKFHEKPEDVSDEDAWRFFNLLTPNPGTFMEYFRKKRLSFGLTPDNGAYEGYGREVLLQLNKDNVYAFLEPILKFILKERPDEILMIDNGARPFEEPLRIFLKKFGFDTNIRFIKVSAQTGGNDVVDVYKALKEAKDDIAGKHVLVIDDNVVRLRTAPMIESALQALGTKRVSISAVTAFNDAAYRFLDVATVHLPGNSQWIDPKRGLVVWTEWEERPELITDQAYLDELAAAFTADLNANRRRLNVQDIPHNSKPVRKPSFSDSRTIMEFITGNLEEAGFIETVRCKSVKFENESISRLIEEYDSGAFKTKWGIDTNLDLRFILRQFLFWGHDGAELLRNEDVLTLNRHGLVRIIRVYDIEGKAHLVLDRVETEDIDDLFFAGIGSIADERGYIFDLASGRDATFSKSGKLRDIFNREFKLHRLVDAVPLFLRDKRGSSLLAGFNEHIRGEVPLVSLPESLTGMPQHEFGARVFSTELAEMPSVDAPKEGLLRYFAVAPELRTFFTNLMLQLEQVLGERVQMLRPHHITDKMRRFLSSSELKDLLESAFVDMKELVFEHDSLASMIYHSVQNMFFDGEERVDLYRVHINMTTINEKDDTNFHGGLYLDIVKQVFQEKFGKVHTVQNPERTTFEFMAQSPRLVRAALANYEKEVRARMLRAEGVDPDIVHNFMPKVVISTRALTPNNFLSYAVRTDEDKAAFKEVIDIIEGEKWPGVSAVPVKDSPRLNKILTAMIFKALLEFNAELAAQANYFEKRVGFGKIVYTEEELPQEGDKGFEEWQKEFLAARMGYVGPGRYDPAYHNAELAGSNITRGSFLDVGLDPNRPQSSYKDDDSLHRLVNRLLKAFPPYQRIAGFISRERTKRGERDEGGLIEQFLRKQAQLAKAAPQDVPKLLAEWKEFGFELLHAFRNFYRWAITEPRNGWILKAHETFSLPRGRETENFRANFFVQEMALKGNKYHVAIEIDSFKAFTMTHVGKVIGENGAANYVDDHFFNMVRDAFFLVAERMKIGMPIITAPGGDHMSISLTLNDSVQPEVYLKEVQMAIKEMFKELTFQDLHKVDLREMRLEGSLLEKLKNSAFREKMRRDMKLLSQPQIAAVHNGSVTIAVDVSVTADDVIEYLKSAGLTVSDLTMLGIEKYRLPMWKNGDDLVFGEAWPEGYKPFTRTLTASFVLVDHPPIKTPADASKFSDARKRADVELGRVKKASWPQKGGFAVIP